MRPVVTIITILFFITTVSLHVFLCAELRMAPQIGNLSVTGLTATTAAVGALTATTYSNLPSATATIKGVVQMSDLLTVADSNIAASTLATNSLSVSKLDKAGGTISGNLTVTGPTAVGALTATTYNNLPSATPTIKGVVQMSDLLTVRDSSIAASTVATNSLDVSKLDKAGGTISGSLAVTSSLNTTNLIAGGFIRPSGGNASGNGIMFPENIGGGTGDSAYIRHYVRSGTESCTLELGTSNDAEDHIFLNPSGNVGIKTATPECPLHVASANGNGVSILGSGDIAAYSDARVKTNITKIDNALTKVCSISGYTFNRVELDKTKVCSTERFAGVIAQEVQKVLPEVVRADSDGMLNVAYGNMVALLIEAVKDLKREIDELKSKT